MDAGDELVHPRSKPLMKMRKRARKACLSCRARKVRCDVSQRGRPCMNCYLDSESCIVTGRASKFHRALMDHRDGIQASHPPYPPFETQINDGTPTDLTWDWALEDEPNSCTNDTAGSGPENLPSDREAFTQHQTTEEGITSSTEHTETWNQLCEATNEACTGPTTSCRGDTQREDVPLLNHLSSNFGALPSNDAPRRPISNVVYCFYPFLAASNIPNIPHEDVNFLELQGCLHVPTRALLDELVRQYFLHIHPFLPLINEGDFWDLYNPENLHPPADCFSLLLFQAMLFASCNFVSHFTMKRLGFQTIRMMRSTFYRRTKLLYDLGAENSHLPMAQTALLLSFASLSSSRKPNTTWLSLAIENAKSVEAHLYASLPTSSLSPYQAILKRVWWCCTIRDRSVGLLMRRPINITRHHFDLNSNPLGFPDLVNEFGRSKVYDAETKRSLTEILERSVKLYIILTDMLVLCFPLDGKQGWSIDIRPENAKQLQECRLALKQWYDHTARRLTVIGGATNPTEVCGLPLHVSQESVVLYTNFMFMYYHTSRAILCHHEVLHLSVLNRGKRASNSYLTKDLSIILRNQSELQDAATSIIKCHEQLVSRRLARWLPVSAIGCTALPLVLNLLDVRLSLPNCHSDGTNETLALKQQRIDILMEVMRAYQPQYDGVDWVSEIIRYVTNLAKLDDSNNGGYQSSIDWAQIFALHPHSYLRFALSLDCGLRTGRLPHEDDFPIGLKEPGVISFSPPNRMADPTGSSYVEGQNQLDATFWQDLSIHSSPLMDSEAVSGIFSAGESFDELLKNKTCLNDTVSSSQKGFAEDISRYAEILSGHKDLEQRPGDSDDEQSEHSAKKCFERNDLGRNNESES